MSEPLTTVFATVLAAVATTPTPETPASAAARTTAAPAPVVYAFGADVGRTDDIAGNGSIALLTGEKRATLLQHRTTDFSAPKFSPDGKRLAWIAIGNKASGVYVGDARGRHAKRLARTAWADGLSWSPDGRTIAFGDVQSGLFTVPADRSARPHQIVPVPEDGGNLRRPVFSPDGSFIVFSKDTYSSNMGPAKLVTNVLLRVQPDGKGLATIMGPGFPEFAAEPSISPDGRSLTFDGQQRGDHGPNAILTSAIDGTGVKTVYTAPAKTWIDAPTWSPDGKRILFATGVKPSQGSSLVLLDPATSKTSTVLRVKKGEFSYPAWRPAAG